MPLHRDLVTLLAAWTAANIEHIRCHRLQIAWCVALVPRGAELMTADTMTICRELFQSQMPDELRRTIIQMR